MTAFGETPVVELKSLRDEIEYRRDRRIFTGAFQPSQEQPAQDVNQRVAETFSMFIETLDMLREALDGARREIL